MGGEGPMPHPVKIRSRCVEAVRKRTNTTQDPHIIPMRRNIAASAIGFHLEYSRLDRSRRRRA